MGKLFEELKRRKVFRVAAVYAVVSWLLIQVADTLSPALQLPQWTVSLVTVLLILGFVPTLIAAWAYEVTPEGIHRDSGARTADASTAAPQTLLYATFTLVLVLAGFQFADRLLFSAPQNISSQAVQQTSNVMRFSLPVSIEEELFLGGRDANFGRPAATSLALTNDGMTLVYSAWLLGTRGRQSQLYIRHLDQIRPQPLLGTEGGASPFLSPDNTWVGFYVEGALKRVPIAGGIPQTVLASTESFIVETYGATWGDNDSIVYADEIPGTDANARIGLYQLPATGGRGELLADPTAFDGQFVAFTQPHFLPGSNGLLFQGLSPTQDPELAEILAMNFTNGSISSLISNAMDPSYSPETGNLLFLRQGQLMAVQFDPAKLEVTGEPVVVADDVMQSLNMGNPQADSGVGQLALSSAGNLIFARGGVTPNESAEIVRVTKDGTAEPFDSATGEASKLMNLRLSPNGTQLAYTSEGKQGTNIRIHDLTRNLSVTLNTGGFRSRHSGWSPDGSAIAFTSNREDGISNIYRMRVDGSDEQPDRLAPSNAVQIFQSWSRLGHIAYLENDDIWIIPPDGNPEPLFTSDALETYATFSPDGRWIAYKSSVAGSRGIGELYLRPFPGPGPATLIASGLISSLGWSTDSSQLYFLAPSIESAGSRRMMEVDINAGRPSAARPLFDPWPYRSSSTNRTYEVLPDKSFLAASSSGYDDGESPTLNVRLHELAVSELEVVLNFFQVLRERVAQ